MKIKNNFKKLQQYEKVLLYLKTFGVLARMNLSVTHTLTFVGKPDNFVEPERRILSAKIQNKSLCTPYSVLVAASSKQQVEHRHRHHSVRVDCIFSGAPLEQSGNLFVGGILKEIAFLGCSHCSS